MNLDENRRLRVKIDLNEGERVPSLTGLYPAAGWWEREAYDMFGIIFTDHKDLKRILTDYDFEGFPLRKDFPLTGYYQVYYDNTEQKVVREPVHLNQAYRTFDTLSPWEGMSHLFDKTTPQKKGEK